MEYFPMPMHALDWLIVGFLLAAISVAAVISLKLTRSVADFLAAGRCGGRYVIAISDGAAGVGVVTFLAMFEMYYQAGFTIIWWGLMTLPVASIITLSGWVVYRYRQTKAMTIGQFLEMRYSRNFRIFAGFLAFLSGIVNFGIFPAVSARFFIYFCRLPETVGIFSLQMPIFPFVMAVLLCLAVFFVYFGGQVTVILTDFLQGILCNVLCLAILAALFFVFAWPQIVDTLSKAPQNSSLLHPFHTTQQRDFNAWYYVIMVFYMFYTQLAFQGQQAFNCSAKSPHEAKMAKVLGTWRGSAQAFLIVMLPICAYTFLNSPDFAAKSSTARDLIAAIGNDTLRTQMTVPVALSCLLPIGIVGGFCAVMLAASIATHSSYMHSWGSIFIQDVIMPLRKTPLTPEKHIRILRLAIIGVAVFAFLFSLVFRQTQYIVMFFWITGAIFLSGAGAVIIGGLYWKKGTTTAAWVSLITGSSLAIAGIILLQIFPKFPINGQWWMFIASLASILAYIIVSVAGGASIFDMDRLLHRGKYSEILSIPQNKPSWIQRLGLSIDADFTYGDKIIYFVTIAWTMMWFLIFVAGTIYNIFVPVKADSWVAFWKFYIYINLVLAIVTTVWFTIGGISNIKQMYRDLKYRAVDHTDDGTVGKAHIEHVADKHAHSVSKADLQ